MSNSSHSRQAARVVAAAAFSIAATLLFADQGATAQGQPPGPAKPPAAAPAPVPKILVIDRNAILRVSKVGQDIVRQVNGYTQAAEKEFKAQGQAMQKDGQALQQQIAILAPDMKEKKIREFQARQADFQKRVEQRQAQIQGGVFKARQQVEQALGPILQGIMQERGANLLLDRAAVVLGTVDVDVTRAAVQRLDQKMPSVKVDLVNPPPGMVPSQQQQQ
jgi:outer membrane protein